MAAVRPRDALGESASANPYNGLCCTVSPSPGSTSSATGIHANSAHPRSFAINRPQARSSPPSSSKNPSFHTPSNGRLRVASLTGPIIPSDLGARPAASGIRQKAVRKSDPAATEPGQWHASDGASLQLLAHEVVYLRTQLPELTDREREVAFAVCSGGSNLRIAERLCIALPTLRTHLMRLNQKLGAARKSDLVRIVASRLLDAYRSHQLTLPFSINPSTTLTTPVTQFAAQS